MRFTTFAAFAMVRFSAGTSADEPLTEPFSVTAPLAVSVLVPTAALLSRMVIGLFQVCAPLDTLLPKTVGPVTISAPTAVVLPKAP